MTSETAKLKRIATLYINNNLIEVFVDYYLVCIGYCCTLIVLNLKKDAKKHC